MRMEMASKPGRNDYPERMRSQVRRLRDLSLDTIDPIARTPSLINEPCSSRAPETNGQRIERVLEDAYDRWIEAHDGMRRAQSKAHNARKQNVRSNDAPEKGCQLS
jgi:hypothetical protein